MAKTVRIFWDKNDKTRFGLQINPHEPPVFDPEINAYFTAMAQLNIEREQVGVFTFELGFPTKYADTPWKLEPEEPRKLNPAHVKDIENIEKAISNPEQYAGKVETDENGEYTGFTLITPAYDPRHPLSSLKDLQVPGVPYDAQSLRQKP